MKSIQQTFSVPFTYAVHFTEDIFNISNPIFAQVVKTSRVAKVFFVIDDGVVNTHPSLINNIKNYAEANT
ncbi:hypothetical protein LZ575_18310 [Antarcticibacterium sp. 1MA-6-2]|uniref:hypothetical protein n=1 Tax=Antarcticibacterium sp. 1MA-6-2 TaxID=2908210 RepID=UPI001F2CFFEE|nr:hypothetical protein [Antarcticibacterium sp. 1MA-6-2]UJH90697.1 hypothetical protein LZ575_18310 [Antarcticibacterium sp. 1MA-6-2]